MQHRVFLRRVVTCLFTAFCFISLSTLCAESANAQQRTAGEPGWYPFVIARGQDRDVIQSTPMHLRPYRPLHFYGNTVRRQYYRSNPAPMPRDVVRGFATSVRRR